MGWIILGLAGILEISWAIALKYSEGFTKLWYSLLAIGGGLLSFWLLNLAMRTIPLGTAYAIWTGIGVIGTAVFGILFLHESASLLRIAFIICLLVGIVGLYLF